MVHYMNGPEIIYSDKNFIVVNKPAGLVVHPVRSPAQASLKKGVEGEADLRLSLMKEEIFPQTSNGVNGRGLVKGKTLVDFLVEKFPEIKNVGDEPKIRPGIVHRLDRDTSGIMIVARNQKTFADLKNLFKQRKIEKRYLVLVCGEVSEKSGKIESPIGRLVKNPTKRGVGQAGKNIKGERDAITYFKIIKKLNNAYTLLAILPKTGRMHQIRVHLKSIGYPVVCDLVYGGKKVCCPNELERMFLHAESLEFSYPEGKRWKFESDLPNDLRSTLETLDKMTEK